jgi:hypothetical protein
VKEPEPEGICATILGTVRDKENSEKKPPTHTLPNLVEGSCVSSVPAARCWWVVASLPVGVASKVWVTARLSVIGVDRARGDTDDIATSR